MKNYEPMKMAKQFLDFQKRAFENSYSTILKFQDHSEKITDTFFTDNSQVPEEGKKILKEWKLAFLNYQTDLKTSVDEGFTKMEDYLSGTEKTTKKDTKTKK